MNRFRVKKSKFSLRTRINGVFIILSGIIFCCHNITFDNRNCNISVVLAEEKEELDEPLSEMESNIEPEYGSDPEPETDIPAGNPVCIVIDPGHGGENLGGEYEDYTEKEMTMIVATAMKEELEKYEDVIIYLTRNADQDLTLEERCEYAESVNADFLFCLHFNLSEYHTLFGAECWVSAFGENYSKGYEFASIEMDMLQDLGLYSRGIKTRLSSRGTDYYGIIRHATERNIPCVLIEHCHLDQENDKPFYDHDRKLKEFGRLDATAVAKYFHLKSEVLGVDYSDYENIVVDVPADVVEPDRTEPDICRIEVLDQNAENGEVTVQVTAADYDSGMLYFTFSIDNGHHFSELQRWPDKSADTFSFTVQIPPHVIPHIVVNAYNGYDLYTTSNTISLPAMDYKSSEEIAAEMASKKIVESIAKAAARTKTETRVVVPVETSSGTDAEYLLAVCIVCSLLVLGMAVSMALIISERKKRRRRSQH